MIISALQNRKSSPPTQYAYRTDVAESACRIFLLVLCNQILRYQADAMHTKAKAALLAIAVRYLGPLLFG